MTRMHRSLSLQELAEVPTDEPTEKLVRDKIPEIIRADGREPRISILGQDKIEGALEAKLIEEVEEFLNAQGNDEKILELADIYEVLRALAQQNGATDAELLQVAETKRTERGGFSEGYLYQGIKF